MWNPMNLFKRREAPEAPEAEAVAPMREAASVSVENDDGWTALTGDTGRDLSPMTQQRMQDMVHYLWERNGIANRMIELPLAFLIAEGVSVKAADDDMQKIINEFWTDPINNLDLALEEFVREFAMYGEQCWPMFVNEVSGRARMGYLDPRRIAEVVMDPDNSRLPVGIVTARDKKGAYRKFRVIYAGDEADLFTRRTQALRESFTDGECFYFTANRTASGKRGRSDLLHVADWADSYEQYLFGELERWDHMRAFVWDVTITGADEAACKKFARDQPPPKPGSQRVHNESVAYNAVTPDLNAADGSVGARMVRNHTLGGGSIPEHWFGGGGDVNRAVGAEMGEPVFKIMSLRQRKWKTMLETVCRWVLWTRLGATSTADWQDELLQVEVVFPELTAKDTTKWAAALQQVVASVVVGVEQGLLTQETAVAIIATIAGRLGVEFDAAEELAAAMAEAKKRKAEAKKNAEDDAFTGPDPDAADAQGEAKEDAAQNTRTAQLGNAASGAAANVAAQS